MDVNDSGSLSRGNRGRPPEVRTAYMFCGGSICQKEVSQQKWFVMSFGFGVTGREAISTIHMVLITWSSRAVMMLPGQFRDFLMFTYCVSVDAEFILRVVSRGNMTGGSSRV